MIMTEAEKRPYKWTKGTVPPANRILARVEWSDPDACWIWPGATDSCGYGRIKVGSRQDGTRRSDSTHRVLFKYFIGPIPEGLELDHLCRTRLCCNPFHLEAVTHQTNLSRLTEDYKQVLRERMALARAARWAA